MESTPAFILSEVGAFLTTLKARGVIAVQTPELAAHIQEQLFARLRADVDAAQREEFLSPEEAEDLYELFDEGDLPTLEDQLRQRLPQFPEIVAQHLDTIANELIDR